MTMRIVPPIDPQVISGVIAAWPVVGYRWWTKQFCKVQRFGLKTMGGSNYMKQVPFLSWFSILYLSIQRQQIEWPSPTACHCNSLHIFHNCLPSCDVHSYTLNFRQLWRSRTWRVHYIYICSRKEYMILISVQEKNKKKKL